MALELPKNPLETHSRSQDLIVHVPDVDLVLCQEIFFFDKKDHLFNLYNFYLTETKRV